MSRAGRAPADAEAADSARLDVWLWRARLARTRALAAELVERQGVRVDRSGLVRKVTKPGATLAIGDVLTLRQGQRLLTVQVRALGERRGPGAEARTLYEDLSPPATGA